MSDDSPLILLPGLGADGRMFSSLQHGLPQLVTPRWIKPLRGESVADYARRFAPVIDPGRPCFIGGASFGGVVAQELAAILPNVRACFVIGSLRSTDAKPWRIRILRPITPMVAVLPWMAPLLVRLLGPCLRAPTRGVLTQLADADRTVLRWGAGAILRWQPSPDVQQVRIRQIHGDADRVFPIGLTKEPDCIVSGAGHLIAITHSRQVLEFLQYEIREIEDSRSDTSRQLES
ncbi:MAG: alpha/beta hydrolase [Planctomycetes bacterium]|nr:alpha/beta hydrolase [Planctomycetota bacterium]